MAVEIERKFLVISDSYRDYATHKCTIKQGYLSRKPESTVRIRIKDDRGFITIKGITVGAARKEWEYPIPVADAMEMLRLCEGAIISKTRYFVPFGDLTWEIDEFDSPRRLTIAEVELSSEDENITLPPFVGHEVTGDPAYYNSNL